MYVDFCTQNICDTFYQFESRRKTAKKKIKCNWVRCVQHRCPITKSCNWTAESGHPHPCINYIIKMPTYSQSQSRILLLFCLYDYTFNSLDEVIMYHILLFKMWLLFIVVCTIGECLFIYSQWSHFHRLMKTSSPNVVINIAKWLHCETNE